MSVVETPREELVTLTRELLEVVDKLVEALTLTYLGVPAFGLSLELYLARARLRSRPEFRQ